MTYSQKYSLVHFIKPIEPGTEFHMSEWPLHTTLADVFAIDRQGSKIDDYLELKLSKIQPVKTIAAEDSTLGTTRVVLLEKTQELLQLHADVVSLLQQYGAVFNTPEFNNEGFIPHSTIQQSERLHSGDEIVIHTLSLVDMFPGKDWQQRKVLETFSLA